MAIVSVQTRFDEPLPTIRGNAEYQRAFEELKVIDRLIISSGIEDEAISYWLDLAQQRKDTRCAKVGRKSKPLTYKEQVAVQERAQQAFRAAILRKLEKTSLRVFCRDVARAPLLQWFCHINRFGSDVKVFGKSTLDNYEKDISLELIMKLEGLLLKAGLSDSAGGNNKLGLEQPIAVDCCYLDTTCIKANIHFPVDWLLLRDAVRSLMLAVNLIRRCGLKNRMPESPEEFIRRINKLSIEMTHARRKADSRKKRKEILRKMKHLVRMVRKHAQRHYDLLARYWQNTEWSRGQAQQVMKRIENIIAKLPQAQKQAHERIIGERQVKNQDKILSMYEDDVRVIVRHKAGAEVEFGNTLILAEQENGLVIDWQLFKDQAPADSKLIPSTVERLQAKLGKDTLGLLGTDRGFDSKANRDLLALCNIFNGMCPRNPKTLKELLEDPRFRQAQKRRSQTEARISILARCFAGTPMLQKGFEHRQQHIGLSVLAHNLWVLARMVIAQRKERERKKAA